MPSPYTIILKVFSIYLNTLRLTRFHSFVRNDNFLEFDWSMGVAIRGTVTIFLTRTDYDIEYVKLLHLFTNMWVWFVVR